MSAQADQGDPLAGPAQGAVQHVTLTLGLGGIEKPFMCFFRHQFLLLTSLFPATLPPKAHPPFFSRSLFILLPFTLHEFFVLRALVLLPYNLYFR